MINVQTHKEKLDSLGEVNTDKKGIRRGKTAKEMLREQRSKNNEFYWRPRGKGLIIPTKPEGTI